MLLVYGVALLGIVPSPAKLLAWFGSQSQERYPCENDGCGCASAGECWSHCCCLTEHERLLWAITNGVQPPDSVRFTDTQWIAAANEIDPAGEACALCVHAIQERLRQGIATPARQGHDDEPGDLVALRDPHLGAACAGGASCGQPASASCYTSKASPAPARSTISALACKGLAQLLLTTLPPAPSSEAERLIVLAPCRHGAVERGEASWTTRSLEVASPPPRPVHI